MKTFREDLQAHLRAARHLLSVDKEWLVIIVTVVMESVSPFITIYLSSVLLNALYAGESVNDIMLLAAAGAAVNFLVNLIRHIAAKKKNILWWSMRYRLAEPLIVKTARMDYELTEDEEIQRMQSYQENLRKRGLGVYDMFIWQTELFLTALLKAVFSLAILVPFLVALARADYRLALSGGVMCLVLMLVMRIGVRVAERENKKRDVLHEQDSHIYQLNDAVIDKVVLSPEAGKDVRIFGEEPLMEEFVEQTLQGWKKTSLFCAKSHAVEYGVQGLVSSVVGGAVYLFLSWCAYGGGILIGNVVRFAGAIQQLMGALNGVMLHWRILHENRTYMEQYLGYLDLPEEKRKNHIPVEKRQDGRFQIEFRHVSFRYPGTQRDILKDMNLKLEIGGRTALVGENGSGKTTFVKLLCRLYDPTEGSIYLNGVDIRKYDYDEYMKLFSVVFQDFWVFPFALGEYVAGSVDVDEDKVRDAVSRAGLGELLGKLTRGFHTFINREFSEDGFNISGGEAQKLAIARAIYKDAPFVILDEPTAALDPVAENDVYTHFHEMIGNKTTLFISHRLSACHFSDEILVFSDGAIVERGNHETLVEQGGLYRKMWDAQAKYYL